MPIFTNQAQLSYNGIVTNSNVATGEWTTVPGEVTLVITGTI